MNRYIFREPALEWLKERGFEEKEIDELERLLNQVREHKSIEDPVVILPKTTSSRVSALVYVLSFITDPNGNPLCFDSKGFIDIPEEAQAYYEEELGIEELEGLIGRLRKVKFGRMHSRPKRRGSVKKERYRRERTF